MNAVQTKYIDADGLRFFYREAGPVDSPVLLALHGYPSSSFQYRSLLAGLSNKYRVIAPDLPGFGFTVVPEERKYEYTFDNIGKSVQAFVGALGLTRYALYVFDYGAPIGWRLALARPEAVTGIISQNGNAFESGFGEFWGLLRPYWAEPDSKEKRDSIRFLTTFDVTKSQYTTGEARPERIPPETYHLDQALLDRPGNAEIQLDLFLDYRHNVAAYPAVHAYFKKHQPPLLAVWGAGDELFIPAGAEAFKEVLPDAKVVLIEGAGHFALENHSVEVIKHVREFLGGLSG
ncbi:Alpha/beta hydrolase fold protein [Rhodotorula toruloides ATCC 204091]|uniref:Alpha/beta hydrolase fold protein n=2 Tax=Rhodotorula toruloides TaxID=5286 RepID=A0A2T0AA34_RHOTO|nr:Alpha/beta hydrolase fold protein [Rhodotorula toruloides ATCC 204091]KAK4333553.1 putative hydrolase [Rhodotorula toruloides]PRQ74859.1 Alpha/beta hydrolase fold protein [Rhodotorula toruloides]